MSTIITRLFHDRGRAASAVAALRRLGFPPGTIHVIERDAAGASSDEGAAARLAQLLHAAQVAPAAAAVYAREAARSGGTLVVVQAGFGHAESAVAELDDAGPVALEVPDRYIRSYSDAAPFSDMLGLPVLTSTLPDPALMRNPAPLSSALGLPVLKDGPGDRSFGLPLLKDGPGDKSFGLPLLKDGPGDRSFGFPLLKDGPGDTSFGFPLLSRNPTPLSSLFGLPVLTKRAGEKRD